MAAAWSAPACLPASPQQPSFPAPGQRPTLTHLRICCNCPACHAILPACLQRGIDLKKIGEGMTGASGAELKAVCTEAGMFALRERRVHVTQVRCWRCVPASV